MLLSDYDYITDRNGLVDQTVIDEVVTEAESYTRQASISTIAKLGNIAISVLKVFAPPDNPNTAIGAYWSPYF